MESGKEHSEDWRDGVKSVYFSRRGPVFGSQHPQWAAHSHLYASSRYSNASGSVGTHSWQITPSTYTLK